jgi:phytanoyl-CoA hydroxylase
MNAIISFNSKFFKKNKLISNVSFKSSIKEKSYKFTLNDTNLNNDQRDYYEKNGFIVFKNLVDEEKLTKFENRFKTICSENIRIRGMTVMKDVSIAKSQSIEGENAITKIQDFCFDEDLFEYCRLEELIKYVKSFTGPNIMAMHT